MQQVINVVRKLKNLTGVTDTIKIVVNVGGFSQSNFIEDDKIIEEMYDNVSSILLKLNCNDYEFIIQTMPPYPWHFGGQSYHNLFLSQNQL